MSSPQSPSVQRRLTVAMIVRDAESLVASTLNSVREFADEIVVGDTGSSDGTKAVVASLADRVIDLPWQDDFSAARNAVLEQVTGDWILWLDAGETLSPAELRVVREHVDHLADPTKVYMSLVLLPNQSGEVSGEQVGRIRLMPRDGRLRFTGRLRETLRPAIATAGMEVGSLSVTIVRDKQDHLASIKQKKARRDMRIADLAMQTEGAQPKLLLAKAEALMTLQDNAAARKLYQQARDASESGSSEMLEAYYGELTTHDGEPEGPAAQIGLCVAALETYPLDAQLLCALGSYLQAQPRVDLATRAYETCVRFGQVNPEIWHLAEITEIVTICLSLCLRQQQRNEEAQQVLEEALTRRPESDKIRQQLIDLHIQHGRRQEALSAVDSLGPETEHREAYRSAIRGACLAIEKNWVAAKAYLQTAYHGGCREAVCFRWLVVTQLALNDQRAVETLLDAWADFAPNQIEIARYRQAIAGRDQQPAESMPQEIAADAPSVPRPKFAQAPAQIAPSSSGGLRMRIDAPNPTGEKPAATPHEQRTDRVPQGFTVDSPRRE